MRIQRRSILVALSAFPTAGCIGTSDSGGIVRLYNLHEESHALHVRFSGALNDEPVLSITKRLEPDENHRVEDRLDLEAIQGDLEVVTRIDDEEERQHDVTGGFASLSVTIDQSGSISFTRGDF